MSLQNPRFGQPEANHSASNCLDMEQRPIGIVAVQEWNESDFEPIGWWVDVHVNCTRCCSGCRDWMKAYPCIRLGSEWAAFPTNPPNYRRWQVFALRGLDRPNSSTVCVQNGPENRITDHKRMSNALQRSHCSSEIIRVPHDGLERFIIKFNGLFGFVHTVCAT